jgi:hypothetical protein
MTGAVTASIEDNAVDSQHYAADSLDAEHYAAGSVDGTAIATDAVTSSKIAADAVGTSEIATNAVTDTELNSAKLNGIESSATADQTAAELLTAIKTVDGGSSGLDAQYISGVDTTSLGYNAKNINSTFTYTGALQTGASGQTYEICTHSTGFWGAGMISFEIWDYYYDTRSTRYGHYLLRSHAHSSYSPSANILLTHGGADQAPHVSAGPVYPSGVIGYFTFAITLPSYQGIRFRTRAQSVVMVSSKTACAGGGKIYFQQGGRI